MMMIARRLAATRLMEDRLFSPDIARSKRGEPPTGVAERGELVPQPAAEPLL